MVDDPPIQIVVDALELGDAQDFLNDGDDCEVARQKKHGRRWKKKWKEEESGRDFIRRERKRRHSLRLFVEDLDDSIHA